MLRLLLWWFWPIRWARALYWAFHGALIMPSALLLGRIGAFDIGRGVKIGARSRLIAGTKGRIVLGKKIWMSTDVEVEADGKISIGSGTTIQRRCSFHGTVRIGRNCLIAPNTFVSSHVHAFHVKPHLTIREQEREVARDPQLLENLNRHVWIQEDCWFGINVFVGPGVTIGKGSIIGANSSVMHDVPPYSIVAGVPARVIDQRLEWVPGSLIDPNNDMHRPYILSGEHIAAQNGEPSKIRITPDESLLVALTKNIDRNVLIRYKTHKKAVIEVNGAQQILSLEENEMTCSFSSLTPCYDSLALQVKIIKTQGCADVLDIFSIECS